MKRLIIVAVILFCVSSAIAQDSLNISTIATLNNIKNCPIDVAVFGNQSLVAAKGRGFFRFNLTDINNPVLIDSSEFTPDFEPFRREENYIVGRGFGGYIRRFDSELGLIDPGFVFNEPSIETIGVSDSLLFTVYYTSEPPPDPNWPYSSYTMHLNIYDISNEPNLENLYYFEQYQGDCLCPITDILSWGESILVSGGSDNCFVLGRFAGIPDYPLGYNMIRKDNYLINYGDSFYNDNNLTTLEVDEDLNMELINELSYSGSPTSAYVLEDTLVVYEYNGNNSHVFYYDISDMANMFQTKQFHLHNYSGYLQDFADNYFHAIEDAEYKIYDFNGEEKVEVFSWGHPGFNADDLIIIDDYAYGLAPEEGIIIYEIGDSGEVPQVVGREELPFPAENIDKCGHTILTRDNSHIVSFTITNGFELSVADTFDFENCNYVRRYFVIDDYSFAMQNFYASDEFIPVDFYHIDENNQISLFSTLNLGDEKILDVYNNNLVLSSDSIGISLLDINNLEDTLRVNIWNNPIEHDFVRDFTNNGQYGYVLFSTYLSEYNLKVFDLSNIYNPQIVDSLSVPASYIHADWGYLFASGGNDEFIHIFDLIESSNPELTGYYEQVAQNLVFHPESRKLFAPTPTALRIFDVSEACINDVEESLSNSLKPESFTLGNAYPNPFNPSVKIPFTLLKSSEISLTIYDILGRQVRKLINNYVAPGKHEINWDSITDTGKMATSGIYFIEFKTGNYSRTEKIVLLR